MTLIPFTFITILGLTFGCVEESSSTSSLRLNNSDSASSESEGKRHRAADTDKKSGGENEGLAGYIANPRQIDTVDLGNGRVRIVGPDGTASGLDYVSFGWITPDQYVHATINKTSVKAQITIVSSAAVDRNGAFAAEVSAQQAGLVVLAGKRSAGVTRFEFTVSTTGASGYVFDWDHVLADLELQPWQGFAAWFSCPEGRSQPAYPEGSGTATDPFTICTAEQFRVAFAQQGNERAYFELHDDIDLGASGYAPTSSDAYRFQGVLDGRGHRLTGVNIATASMSELGLIGYADNAKITNLYLAGRLGDCLSSCGMLAGTLKDTVVENVRIEVQMDSNGTATMARYGGVAGRIFGGRLTKVAVNVEMVSANGSSGGIAGECTGVSLSEVGVSGRITTQGVGAGICGRASAMGSSSNLYVYANVVSTDEAYALWSNGDTNPFPQLCIVFASIESSFANPASKLVKTFPAENRKCKWLSNYQPGTNDAAWIQEVSDINAGMEVTYPEFDFVNIWRTDPSSPDQGYPRFQFEPEIAVP